eukprot:1777229-Amphidinium_carterae.2
MGGSVAWGCKRPAPLAKPASTPSTMFFIAFHLHPLTCVCWLEHVVGWQYNDHMVVLDIALPAFPSHILRVISVHLPLYVSAECMLAEQTIINILVELHEPWMERLGLSGH